MNKLNFIRINLKPYKKKYFWNFISQKQLFEILFKNTKIKILLKRQNKEILLKTNNSRNFINKNIIFETLSKIFKFKFSLS